MYHKNKDIRSVRSKEWIYEALCKLIDQKDFRSITVTELIKVAGVGRSTFYRNYDMIEDVLIERLDSEFEKFYEYIFTSEQVKMSQLSPRLFIPVFEYWEKDATILEVLLKADLVNVLNSTFDRYIEMIINKYPLFELTAEEMKYSTVIITGIIQSVMVKWIEGGRVESARQIAKIIAETAFKDKTHQV